MDGIVVCSLVLFYWAPYFKCCVNTLFGLVALGGRIHRVEPHSGFSGLLWWPLGLSCCRHRSCTAVFPLGAAVWFPWVEGPAWVHGGAYVILQEFSVFWSGSLCVLSTVCRHWCHFFIRCWADSPVKAALMDVFSVGKLEITNSLSADHKSVP
jgi:hypothetical protein